MTAFAIYNDAGEILRTGSCPESDLALKAGDGEYLYIGPADQDRHRVVDGALVSFIKTQPEDLQKQIRLDRNALLAKSDWTQMPDAPLSDAAKAQWADYRQALRDLPQNVGEITSLEEVVWPIPPN